jgi:hypothetical protein
MMATNVEVVVRDLATTLILFTVLGKLLRKDRNAAI